MTKKTKKQKVFVGTPNQSRLSRDATGQMSGERSKKTVYVGLSGGVDSSVSATLLKEQGYNVVGVFIKAWEPENFDCGWREERRDAMRVSAHLNIPFITLDLSKEYKEGVVDYMVAEYKAGCTPNPDVMCNKIIKFGAFFDWAMTSGADFVATGHYARIRKNPEGELKTFEMLVGIDNNKDQTYFLWTLKQKQLVKILFPIGHLEKPKVRKLAIKFNLPTQNKKDSQGVCFIGKLDIKDFLQDFIEHKIGDVLNKEGKVIGQHKGVLFYTLGERHGFEIFKKNPNEKPLYVVAKDLLTNTITVSDTLLSGMNDNEIIINSINWVSGQIPDLTKNYKARIRYRQPLENCHLEMTPSKEKIKVIFDNPQTSIAIGQSLVLYDGEVCLGGGIIHLVK